MWVKYTEEPGSGQSRRIVGKGAEGSGSGYFIGLEGDGRLALGVGAIGGLQSDSILLKTTTVFSDGKWYYVVATVDRTNAKAKIYVNGEAQLLVKEAGTGGTISGNEMSLAGLTNLSASGTGAPFTVASFSGTTAYFRGEVDNVQIHRAVLEEEDALAEYNVSADPGSTPDGLPDRWEWANLGTLDEGDSDDGDGDGLSNLQEYLGGTDPADGIGVTDTENLIELKVYTPLR